MESIVTFQPFHALSIWIVKTPPSAGEFFVQTGYDGDNTRKKEIMNEQPDNREPFDRREARHQRRAERLADPSRGGSWIAGIILIVLGGIFLLQNMGSYRFPFQNWWALFILIPAVGAFDTAFRAYRHAGTFTAAARGSLLVGIVLTLVTAGFLFNIGWSYFGPALIILAGLGMLANGIFSGKDGSA